MFPLERKQVQACYIGTEEQAALLHTTGITDVQHVGNGIGNVIISSYNYYVQRGSNFSADLGTQN